MNNDIFDHNQKYLERKSLYQSFGYNVDGERDFILRQAEPFTGRILEAGTGKGHFSLALARAGYSFVTFDISADEQRFARMNIENCGFSDKVEFRIENGESMSFRDGSFDVVFSVNMLHHLRSPYLVINDLIRVISDKGKFVLSDFTLEGFKVIDQVHASEGSKHEVGGVSLSEVEAYLLRKNFLITKVSTLYQGVIVAQKNSGQI